MNPTIGKQDYGALGDDFRRDGAVLLKDVIDGEALALAAAAFAWSIAKSSCFIRLHCTAGRPPNRMSAGGPFPCDSSATMQLTWSVRAYRAPPMPAIRMTERPSATCRASMPP
jgi:hypothetical protein